MLAHSEMCELLFIVFRFFRQDDGTWKAELVIDVPAKKVEGWLLPEMNGTTLCTTLVKCSLKT
jgi:hypothetical protein